MERDFNILILSCGTRNKIVQYFKKELKGRGSVMATDCSFLAPALYDADRYFIVPRVDEPGYIEEILRICKENNIRGVLSLIDHELPLLAQHKKDFLELGTIPIVSNYEIVELCFDKYKMYKYLTKNNISTVKSYNEKEKFYKDLQTGKVEYPVFVKPVKGSASININKVYSKEEIEMLFNRFDDLIIQEYMDGTEYGADVYIDMVSEIPVAIFIKKKIKMKAGETDKSISVKDERLFEIIKKFVGKVQFKGIIDIDIFKVKGEYYISEVNPRFGGGYPHAYESGVNIPKLIINNLYNKANNNIIGRYDNGIYMTKFSDIQIISTDGMV